MTDDLTKQVELQRKCTGEHIYKNIRWNECFNLSVLQRVEQFQFVDSDVIVSTFPRTGTTFVQEIMWQVLNIERVEAASANSPDNNVTFGPIMFRFPFLEINTHVFDANAKLPVDTLDRQRKEMFRAGGSAKGRLIKTHCPLPFIRAELQKAQPKIVLVFRNPCDTCVSYFDFYKGMPGFNWTGEFDEYVELFVNGQTVCGSYFDWVRDWLREAGFGDAANKWPIGSTKLIEKSRSGWSLLLVRYEDLINHPHRNITAIAQFLDVTLTDLQLEVIVRNTAFKTMKSDAQNNFTVESTGFQFLRKGQIGNWKKWMNEEQRDQIRQKMLEKLDEFQIEFEYE